MLESVPPVRDSIKVIKRPLLGMHPTHIIKGRPIIPHLKQEDPVE